MKNGDVKKLKELEEYLNKKGYAILKTYYEKVKLNEPFRKTISLPTKEINTLLQYGVIENEIMILIIAKKKQQ